MKREEAYKWAGKQVRSKVKKHVDTIATLANTAAILKDRFPNYFWVGFYILKGKHLILGPFQGPPACMKLELNAGVCAASANSKKTVIVPDVHQFPGHVACDSRSNSEIVVPLLDANGNLRAVLDVDSETHDDFSTIDQQGLETIAELLKEIF
ncbi:MAG: GAF domain-containing protein [bacterium]|nr:GAF domain-containing protein [bacterium]